MKGRKGNPTKKQEFDLEFKYHTLKSKVSKKLTCRSYKFWNSICYNNRRNLPEDFIREYKEFVNWEYISKYENLSLDFIVEFGEYIKWEWVYNRIEGPKMEIICKILPRLSPKAKENFLSLCVPANFVWQYCLF